MTLVEFFSNCQIKNIISSLIINPDKIIFVGYEEVMTPNIIESTKKYLTTKKINAQTEFINVKKHSMKDAVRILSEIYQRNPDCIFDFTGGEELILAGMGYVMARFNVNAMEVNIQNNLVYMNIESNDNPKSFSVANSVYENLSLYGGVLDKSKQKSSRNILSDCYKDDIYGLWNICKQNNTLWNSTSGIFKTIEGNIYPRASVNIIFTELKKNGYIKVIKTDKKNISFEYKNKMVEVCLKDPGVVLELYTYFALKECDELSDVQVGVIVDWDGKIHNVRERSKDTSNEIDVVAMCGVIPLYISCKNGKVTKETLYELETVSKRFGGVYSKKVLVAPVLNEENISHKYLLNRAEDMGITVIADVSDISKEEYKERIVNLLGM